MWCMLQVYSLNANVFKLFTHKTAVGSAINWFYCAASPRSIQWTGVVYSLIIITFQPIRIVFSWQIICSFDVGVIYARSWKYRTKVKKKAASDRRETICSWCRSEFRLPSPGVSKKIFFIASTGNILAKIFIFPCLVLPVIVSSYGSHQYSVFVRLSPVCWS